MYSLYGSKGKIGLGPEDVVTSPEWISQGGVLNADAPISV